MEKEVDSNVEEPRAKLGERRKTRNGWGKEREKGVSASPRSPLSPREEIEEAAGAAQRAKRG